MKITDSNLYFLKRYSSLFFYFILVIIAVVVFWNIVYFSVLPYFYQNDAEFNSSLRWILGIVSFLLLVVCLTAVYYSEKRLNTLLDESESRIAEIESRRHVLDSNMGSLDDWIEKQKLKETTKDKQFKHDEKK